MRSPRVNLHSIFDLFWGWNFLPNKNLMVVATVKKQMFLLDFIALIVHDGQEDRGLKDTAWWYQRSHLRTGALVSQL